MANTTSGTTTFDKTFSVDEIIEEAFERLRYSRRNRLSFKDFKKIFKYNVSRVGQQRYYTIGKLVNLILI